MPSAGAKLASVRYSLAWAVSRVIDSLNRVAEVHDGAGSVSLLALFVSTALAKYVSDPLLRLRSAVPPVGTADQSGPVWGPTRALGRTVLRNGLMAYVAFQATGNDPAIWGDPPIVANPPPNSLEGLPCLRLIQSLWAGVDRLLDALARLADTPWRLEVIGFGPERAALWVRFAGAGSRLELIFELTRGAKAGLPTTEPLKTTLTHSRSEKT